MKNRARATALSCGLALVSLVAACGTNQAQPRPPGGEAPPPPAVTVANAKDAGARPLCDLLPAAAAQSLGLKPEGELQENPLQASAPPSCLFRYPGGGGEGLRLTVDDRRIADYVTKPAHPFSSNMEVAGNPAVSANLEDPKVVNVCDIYLGTQDDQILLAQTNIPMDKRGSVDSCEVSRKALEAAFATLPPAK